MSRKLDIISLYTGDYLISYNLRTIARLIEANHQTALNHCNELIGLNILKFRRNGRNKELSLNLDNHITKLMIKQAEIMKSIRLMQIGKVKLVLDEILENSESVVVFGSYATGDYDKRSDLDLIIINGKKIKKDLGLEINPHYLTFTEFKKRIGSTLGKEILKKHVLLGNICKIIEIFWRYHDERR